MLRPFSKLTASAICLVALSGCSTTQWQNNFPDPPASMTQPIMNLPPILKEGIDETAGSELSPVTGGRLIEYTHEVIDQYNQAKNQCNALIDWHEKQKNEREK